MKHWESSKKIKNIKLNSFYNKSLIFERGMGNNYRAARNLI